MDLVLHSRSILSFVLFVAFALHIYGETTCPHSVKVEKGTDSNIVCKPDKTNANFFWYKGESKEKDLIGKLEDGLVTVSEQYMGAYDIDSSASLRIRNAGLSHQSLYTLVTFNTNGTSEEDKVILEVTSGIQEEERVYLRIKEPCDSAKPETSRGDVKSSIGIVSGILVILILMAVL